MPWCVVQKKFGGPHGAPLLVNQLVELPDGTRLNQLTEQRYVRPATPSEVANAVEVDVAPPPRTPSITVRRKKRKAS